MSCINKSSKEFKELANQTNLNPEVLAAKIQVYQKKNRTDEFPTINQLLGDSFIVNRDKVLVPVNQENSKFNEELYNKVESLGLLVPGPTPKLESDNTSVVDNKIKRLTNLLDAKVIKDSSLTSSGRLLSSEHPLSKKYNKPVILVNPNKLNNDTVEHEFSHLVIELMSDTNQLQEALAFAINSPESKAISELYPELSKEDLAKETLASLMGKDLADKLKHDVSQISTFSRILNDLLDLMASMFNIKKENIIKEINKQFLNQTLNLSPIESFNNTIDRNQKFSIDKSKTGNQKAVVSFLQNMNDSYTLNEDTHVYSDKDGTEYKVSVTKAIERIFGNKRFLYRKGTTDIPFEEDYLSSYEFARSLETNTKFSHIYDNLLNDLFKNRLMGIDGNVDGIEIKDYWHNEYRASDAATKASMRNVISDNIDELHSLAVARNIEYMIPSASGTYLHSMVQSLIEGKISSLPSNIENSELLTKEIMKIMERADKEGSVLMAETTIFSSNTNNPGQIDILEITKDGKFRIYDVKTKKASDFDTVTPGYISRTYMNQQIAYSLILEGYGLEPVTESPLNVLLVGVDNVNFNSGNKDITLTKSKMFNINPSSTNYNATYKRNKAALSSNFMSKKILSDYGIKSLEEKVKEANKEVNKVIKQYALDTGIDNPLNAKFKDVSNYNTHMRTLIGKLRKLEAKQKDGSDVYMINDFVDSFIMTAEAIEADGSLTTKNAYVDKNYLANLRHFEMLGPTLESLGVLMNDILLQDSDVELGADAVLISNKLKEAITFYNLFKDGYRQKSIEYLAGRLAEHSTFQKGAYSERFELEARALGITDRTKLNEFITNKLSDPVTASVIQTKEMNYWMDKLTNGIEDMGYMYKHLADPGINKAKLVQVLKVMMDVADQNVRYYLENNMPDLVAFEKTLKLDGNTTRKKFERFLQDPTMLMKDKYIKGGLDKEVVAHYKKNPSTMLIPKEISEMYEIDLTLKLHYDYYSMKVADLNKGKGTSEQIEEYENKIQAINERQKEFYSFISKMTTEKAKSVVAKKPNPAYTKLKANEKIYLDYFTNNIVEQEDQIIDDIPFSMRLVHTTFVPKVLDKGEYQIKMVSLPKITRSSWENGTDVGATISDKIESLKEIVRPSGDNQDLVNDVYSESRTDLANREVNDIPLFHRNNLQDPSLQSFDIPTMLAMNMQAVQQYKEYRMLEADVTLMIDTVRGTPIIAKDSLMDKKRRSTSNDSGNVIINSDALVKTLENVALNKMYAKSHRGIHSKGSYIAVQSLAKVRSIASDVLLTLNYNSGITTAFQGTLYRFIEGFGGEYFTMKDSRIGSRKAWKDYNKVAKDLLYSNYPTSKSILMIRKFGLEADYKALVRKFVQDSAVSKSLSKDQLYAFTTMAEYLVTSSLMYSVMNNIKVLNNNKEYIDKEGNVVSEDKAMTLDEAYTVKDGKLVLDKNVTYTNRSLIEKFNDSSTGDNTMEALRVGNFISGIYKNLFGQYDKKMKSNLEMTILGDSLMHLRKWAVRGAFNRFSGITSTIGLSFEERRMEENLDKRHYSEELGSFKEGYVTTTLSYAWNVSKRLIDLKNGISGLSASHKSIYSTMTGHEKANLKRALTEAVAGGILYISVMLLARIAYQDDDDNDEAIWFLAYTLVRVRDEATFFYNPYSIKEVLESPITGMSVLDNIAKVVMQATTYTNKYKTGEIDWKINDIYQSGRHKDKLKILQMSKDLLYGHKKVSQALNLLGVTESDESNSFRHSAEFMIEN